MVQVGSGFEYPHAVLPFSVLKTIRQVRYNYEDPPPPRGGPLYWMSYLSESTVGAVRFLPWIYTEYPVVADKMVEFMESVLDLDVRPDPSKVNLMWTSGDVLPHVDVETRQCSFNIGVMNSEQGTTYISEATSVSTWNGKAKIYVCQDGCGYLVNTSKVHGVKAKNSRTDRLLLTYGFSESYEDMTKRIKA
jgi:hypothetical protein